MTTQEQLRHLGAWGRDARNERRAPSRVNWGLAALDLKKDLEGEMRYLHPTGCFWRDQLPMPASASAKTYSYYKKWLEGQDNGVAHNMIPVSVVVVDDVAIINFYLHILTRDDDGEQKELIIRGHNTWKKENDRWLLLATYNTKVDVAGDD